MGQVNKTQLHCLSKILNLRENNLKYSSFWIWYMEFVKSFLKGLSQGPLLEEMSELVFKQVSLFSRRGQRLRDSNGVLSPPCSDVGTEPLPGLFFRVCPGDEWGSRSPCGRASQKAFPAGIPPAHTWLIADPDAPHHYPPLLVGGGRPSKSRVCRESVAYT